MGVNILDGLLIEDYSPGLEIEWFPGVRNLVGGLFDRRSLTHWVNAWRSDDAETVRWPGVDRDGGAFIWETGALDYLRSIGVFGRATKLTDA